MIRFISYWAARFFYTNYIKKWRRCLSKTLSLLAAVWGWTVMSGNLCYGDEPDSLYAEAVKNLQEYLRIDTTNPPGNEMKAALFLKKILDKEQIPNQIFDLGNNRANFYAVLRGNGAKRPMVLLHHMDVVPADPKYWRVPPFSGEIIDGEIYGRGAIDIKGKGIIDLMTMINLKRKKVELQRDLILLAVADEEKNSLGARWMLHQKDLLHHAEFLIDEGEGIRVNEKRELKGYFFSFGEKAPLWLTITFTGPSGHGSLPIEDSSVNKAIRAAYKILHHPMDFVVLPALEKALRYRLGNVEVEKIPGYVNSFAESIHNKIFLEEISRRPEINALVRNTVSITCLKGSESINTIPNEASIGLDCRLMPGVERDAFIASLKKCIGDDSVRIQIEEYLAPTQSPTDTDFVKALRVCAVKRNPNARVIPTLLTSSTDSSYFRTLGIHAYGFEPYQITEEEAELAHGNNERLSVANVQFGIDLLTDIVVTLNK